MKDKIEAGRRVVARLFPAENTIDDALVANAALTIATVEGRKVLQSPCGANQKALAALQAAGAHLVEARQATVLAHAEFVRIRADEGLETVPFGCDQPCLSTEGREQPRLVAAS